MVKLLIADDEPLVCVGVQSMLPWAEMGIEVVGTARNGQQALDMIEQSRPDIVISDIKMPLKNGLEVVKESGERFGRLPVFIMLTSYEDFNWVREAIRHQAVDYLVKLELDEQTLRGAIQKALEIVQQNRMEDAPGTYRANMQVLREKFFIRLFNNLFESEEQYRLQKEDLGIRFGGVAWAVATCELKAPTGEGAASEKSFDIYTNAIKMVRSTLSQQASCYVVALDLHHFAVIFSFEPEQLEEWKAHVSDVLAHASEMLFDYLGVRFYAAVGSLVEDKRQIGASYHAARWRYHGEDTGAPVVFCDDGGMGRVGGDLTALHSSRIGIRRAFEELDAKALNESITELVQQLLESPEQHIQAMDTASSVLYMAISLLPEGEQMMEKIFESNPDGYRSLYRLGYTEAIVEWLAQLRDGCVEQLQNQRQSYKQQVVASVQAYIRENLSRRLTLHDVAAVFNFSPNYLSQLFSQYAGEGFVEYINATRISVAKEMLARGEGKIYEISEQLGFESSFYFSKVFKKIVGVSPREYMQGLEKAETGEE